jgi:hypothetical protein
MKGESQMVRTMMALGQVKEVNYIGECNIKGSVFRVVDVYNNTHLVGLKDGVATTFFTYSKEADEACKLILRIYSKR